MVERKILMIDNDSDFLDTRAEDLEKAGFAVIKAASLEQVDQILTERWVHLMIIDLRLRDDSDERDTSGLSLAKQECYHPVPKIILTRFPGYEHVREALGPALNGLPPAVDFLAKQEGPQAMQAAVEGAFAKYARLNEDLTIRWEAPLSFFQLTNLIEPERDNYLIADRAGELEDLFRRLFYPSSQITIKRLFTGRDARITLAVHTFSGQGEEKKFVVACGRREGIQQEIKNYEIFASDAAGEGNTIKSETAETIHFAAIAYTLIGADLTQLTTLAEFYRHNPAEVVVKALSRLFTATLSPRYKKGRTLEETETLKTFFFNRLALDEEAVSQLTLNNRFSAIRSRALYAGLIKPDDLKTMVTVQPVDEQKLFNPPFLCGVSYGRLDGDGVLVDRQGETWLIDFSRVNKGPLLHDFVLLETTIKLELLSTPDLSARRQMEERLLAVSGLDEAAAGEDLDADVRKAVQAITHIRRQASMVIGSEIGVYQGGLFLYVIKQLANYDPEVHYTRSELVPFGHSLLFTAELYRSLIPSPPEDLAPEAFNSLWIDESNKEVWVKGKRVHITSQEFDLLLYLYHHQGQLCPRPAIAEHVFDVEFGPDVSEWEKKKLEDTRLNATMSRLRRKIEPDPDRPQYISVVRGEGYRLELN